MGDANQIQLSGQFVREEDVASETIKPGHLVEVHTSTGRKLRKHATAKGFAERAFAVEDPLQGKTAASGQARGIDDAYVATEIVQYNISSPGARVSAWLKAGENVAIGDKLVSAGDGTLQETSSGDLDVVAIADEALDLSASGAVATRIDVRIK
jgi:hypothetical protein